MATSLRSSLLSLRNTSQNATHGLRWPPPQLQRTLRSNFMSSAKVCPWNMFSITTKYFVRRLP